MLPIQSSTLAMAFTVISLLQILARTQRCGLRTGLDGFKLSAVLFLTDQWKTLHFPWHVFFKEAEHSRITTVLSYKQYHGGINFGPTSGGPFITTSYDYDSPIDEYGVCYAFLANIGTQSDVTVNFNGNSYHLPAWSVSILPDCKNVIFNTAK
ncbi:hypothetical protein MKX01_039807, partial [Papaver californicum]